MLDIKEDIREECAKIGDVTNVVLYDKEPDGVASVRFSSPEAARACVNVSFTSASTSTPSHPLPQTTLSPFLIPLYQHHHTLTAS